MDFHKWDRLRLENAYEHSYSSFKKPLDSEQFISSICLEPISADTPYRIESSLRFSKINEPTEEIVDIESCNDDEIWFSDANSTCSDSFNFLIDVNASIQLSDTSKSITHQFTLDNYPRSFSSSPKAWITPIRSVLRRMEKFLYRCRLFDSCKFSRQASLSSKAISVRRMAKKIRDMFSSNIEMCVIVHHFLLELLPDAFLILYIEGFAELWRQNKINKILTIVNVLIRDRYLLKRFPYQRFIHKVVPQHSQEESLANPHVLPFICRITSNLKNPSAAALGLKPLWNSNSDISINFASMQPYPSAGPTFSWNSIIGHSGLNHTLKSTPSPNNTSSLVQLPSNPSVPVFACITYPSSRSSRRMVKMLRHLSELGRMSLDTPEEQSCDTFRLRLRYFTRRVIALVILSSLEIYFQLEESRNGPVFVVGFGLGSVLALISLLHLININGVHLANPEVEKAPTLEAPTQQHAWLCGFICVGMPLLGLKGDRGSALDPILSLDRRFCGIFIVGANSRLGNTDHMAVFRDKILAYQHSKRQKDQINTTNEGMAKLCPQNHPVGLRVLSIGGADHLLRIRPSTASRWNVTQDAIDCSIAFSIAQFVCDCKEFGSNILIEPNYSIVGQNVTTATRVSNTNLSAASFEHLQSAGSPVTQLLTEQPDSPHSLTSVHSSTGSSVTCVSPRPETVQVTTQHPPLRMPSILNERIRYQVPLSTYSYSTNHPKPRPVSSKSSQNKNRTHVREIKVTGRFQTPSHSGRNSATTSYSHSPLASINRQPNSTAPGSIGIHTSGTSLPPPRRQQAPVPRVHHTTPSYLSLVQSQGRTMPRILQQSGSQNRRTQPTLTTPVIRAPGRYNNSSSYNQNQQTGTYLAPVGSGHGTILATTSINSRTRIIVPSTTVRESEEGTHEDYYISSGGFKQMLSPVMLRPTGSVRSSSNRRKVNHQALSPMDVALQSPSQVQFVQKMVNVTANSSANSPVHFRPITDDSTSIDIDT